MHPLHRVANYAEAYNLAAYSFNYVRIAALIKLNLDMRARLRHNLGAVALAIQLNSVGAGVLVYPEERSPAPL